MTDNQAVNLRKHETLTEAEAATYFGAPKEARPYVLKLLRAQREQEDRPTDVEFMDAFVSLVATAFPMPSFEEICARYGGFENTRRTVLMVCEARLHEVRTGMPARAVVRKAEDGYEVVLVKCHAQ